MKYPRTAVMIFENDDIVSQIIYHLDVLTIRNLSCTCRHLYCNMPEIISLSMAVSNFHSMPSTSSIEWDEWNCTRDRDLTQNHKNLAIASGDAYSVFFSSPDDPLLLYESESSRKDEVCVYSMQEESNSGSWEAFTSIENFFEKHSNIE